ncbi:hypothetical protein G5V59_10160 [Nocardioides sp. W3-2-3]|uniref:hypothetical protein n=1 Tax=Nocardioides convexus TaxID=2712224 RepID=UPI0024181A8B|nr:hypothetical protein [Nocardioides convexus]NHA00351.1 hypothetical protein [Nocardioides convexus]
MSLGDADRFGMRSAALQTTAGTYVAPSPGTLAKAVSLMHQAKKYEPFAVSQKDVVAAGTAYPGTMVVYTTARMRNLDKAQAKQVASLRPDRDDRGPGARSRQRRPAGWLPASAQVRCDRADVARRAGDGRRDRGAAGARDDEAADEDPRRHQEPRHRHAALRRGR